MHAGRETQEDGAGSRKRGRKGTGTGEETMKRFIGQRPRQSIRKKGQSVSSWSKPQILVQRERQIEEGKEAALPLCDQYEHGSFVNRTIVLLKLELLHFFCAHFRN